MFIDKAKVAKISFCLVIAYVTETPSASEVPSYNHTIIDIYFVTPILCIHCKYLTTYGKIHLIQRLNLAVLFNVLFVIKKLISNFAFSSFKVTTTFGELEKLVSNVKVVYSSYFPIYLFIFS